MGDRDTHNKKAAEKSSGSGTFEVTRKYGESDEEAVEHKLKTLRNRVRDQIRDISTKQTIGEIKWEIAEKKTKTKKGKDVLCVNWWVEKSAKISAGDKNRADFRFRQNRSR